MKFFMDVKMNDVWKNGSKMMWCVDGHGSNLAHGAHMHMH